MTIAGRKLNVLLITLDTTRADRLGCYGYARANTPNLDALARNGVRFANAYAQVPLTLPSHASIMTGPYPFAHGVHNNGAYASPSETATLAKMLKDQGLQDRRLHRLLLGRLPLRPGPGLRHL